MGMTQKHLTKVLAPLLALGAATACANPISATSVPPAGDPAVTVETTGTPPAETSTAPRQGLLSGRPMAPAVSPEIAKARELIAAEQWREASDLVDFNLGKRPRDPQWRFLQGVIAAQTGRVAEAVIVFELLTEDFPELAEPYNNLAALYVEQNDLHKARLLLERAILNRPDYALAHENLADIYTRLATRSYQNAVNAKEPSPSARDKFEYLLKTPAIRPTRILTPR